MSCDAISDVHPNRLGTWLSRMCICFAILVGISVDFVIHLSHSYTHLPGHR